MSNVATLNGADSKFKVYSRNPAVCVKKNCGAGFREQSALLTPYSWVGRVLSWLLDVRRIGANMRIRPIIAVAFAAALFASTSAGAATLTLFNTGVDSSGSVLPDGTVSDPHYTLVSVPGGTTQTLVRTSAGGFPIPPYIGDNSLSAWIGPNNANDLTGPDGNYDYQMTFSLVGFNAATASITGRWSSDNAGISILLNGVDTGNAGTSSTQYSAFAPFIISSGFVSGLNTLDFLVNNEPGSTDNPTALRVELSGTADMATPLPAALPIFASGLGVLGILARRRKRKVDGHATA